MLIKGHWLIIHLKIKRFRLWLPLPLYILQELLWQLVELTDLIGTFGSKELREMKSQMPTILIALDSIGEGGQYDLVEIDADGGDGDRVRLVIKVR
ncbi:MAG: hypothetical protein J7L77_02060 [Clostridiales bacterium]|nr:hypothetical protein [Clostridiales bacterium]